MFMYAQFLVQERHVTDFSGDSTCTAAVTVGVYLY